MQLYPLAQKYNLDKNLLKKNFVLKGTQFL